MDVKDFISNALKQVSEAISESNCVLNKPDKNSPLDGVSYVYEGPGQHGWATNIEFDIAVTVNESEKGGVKLNVPVIGSLGAGIKSGTETTSRIKFKIPIMHITEKYKT